MTNTVESIEYSVGITMAWDLDDVVQRLGISRSQVLDWCAGIHSTSYDTGPGLWIQYRSNTGDVREHVEWGQWDWHGCHNSECRLIDPAGDEIEDLDDFSAESVWHSYHCELREWLRKGNTAKKLDG